MSEHAAPQTEGHGHTLGLPRIRACGRVDDQFPRVPLRRTLDARFLNEVANHPEVRPGLGGAGAIDLTATLANPANVALQCEHGGFVGVKLDDLGLYECHSLFLPEGREHTTEAMRSGLRYLFCETDCSEVVTKVPEANRGAVGLARIAGFRTVFERAEFQTLGKTTFASLPFVRWVATDPGLAEHGKWFHTRLEELTEGKIPEHPEEEIHNRMVGASVLMLRAGNSIKACAYYNRWALFAGYPIVRLVSQFPPIIDMDQVVVTVQENDMEILKCR